MDFECRLKEMRFKYGNKTQQQLHEMTGISLSKLSQYENNKTIMSLPTAFIISKALGCRVDSLYKIIK
jgi:transcriptional regulator with XRE-family HTH domain